jgi:hypothetical protein
MSLILQSVTLPYWLVMEIENLLGWEHTLQINNQLIKHNIATIFISSQYHTNIITPPAPHFDILLCFGLIPHTL